MAFTQRLPYAASPGAFVYKREKISQFFTTDAEKKN